MRVIALVLLLSLAGTALAQLRAIPKEAQRGMLRHLAEMRVELDGQPMELSVGAQIRDADNRLVLPASLGGRADVMYLLDASGKIHRVWVLSAREAAENPLKLPYPR